MNRLSLIFFLSLMSPLSSFPQPAEPYKPIQASGLNMIWPTDASHELTSTFAEFRSTHYHYGIDIKTWNQTGYKVFSAETGYVSRIRVSPTGYGKALYITHPGGFVTVYGHLDGFAGKIGQFVRKKHYELEKNELNLFLNPKDLPVKKGDLVAFTGETGVGTPHLHFEIRDPEGNELNPLFIERGEFQDEILPVIKAFAVKPAQLSDEVNGKSVSAVYRNFRKAGPGLLILDEVPEITGQAGFLVDGYDLSSARSNQFGYYDILLEIDSKPFFRTRYDSFPVESARFILTDRDQELAYKGEGRFIKLFRTDETPVKIHTDYSGMQGWAGELQPGEHAGKLTVSDLYGNKTSLEFRFRISGTEKIAHAELDQAPVRSDAGIQGIRLGTKDQDFVSYDFNPGNPFFSADDLDTVLVFCDDHLLRVVIQGKRAEQKAVKIAVIQGSDVLVPVKAESGPDELRVDFPVPEGKSDYSVSVVVWSGAENLFDRTVSLHKITTSRDVKTPSGSVVSFSTETFFSPQWISLTENGKDPAQSGYFFSIGPPWVAFHKSAKIQFSEAGLTPGTDLYRKRRGHLQFADRVDLPDLAGSIQAGGTYCLSRDTVPPVVLPKPGKNNLTVSPGTKLKFRLTDTGSGLVTGSIEVNINGSWCLAEFDPEKELLAVDTQHLKPGSLYVITVRVSDQAGNKTAEKFEWKGKRL